MEESCKSTRQKNEKVGETMLMILIWGNIALFFNQLFLDHATLFQRSLLSIW